MKAYSVYQFTFSPVVGLKSSFPQYNGRVYRFLWWGIRTGNTYRLYIMPTEQIGDESKGIAPIIIAILAILGLGIGYLFLRETKNVSGIFYAGISVAGIFGLSKLGLKLGR